MSDRKQLPGRPYVFSRTFPNSGTRNRARPDPAKRLSVLARTARHRGRQRVCEIAESASKRALAGKAMANVHEKFAKIPGKKEVNPRED